MKRLLLILVLLISVTSFSQEVFYCNTFESFISGNKESSNGKTFMSKYIISDNRISEEIYSEPGIEFYKEKNLQLKTYYMVNMVSDVTIDDCRIRIFSMKDKKNIVLTIIVIKYKKNGNYHFQLLANHLISERYALMAYSWVINEITRI